jgi:hypothetical protein
MGNRGFAKLGIVFAAALAVGVPAGASSAATASPTAARSIIPVGKQGTYGPSTVTAVGSTAYVTVAPLRNFALQGYLAYVDLGRKRVVARVNVGPNPEGFAFDGATGLGYVSNYDQHGTIRVVNLRAGKVVRTLPAGQNPWSLAVVGSRQGGGLVVLNNGGGKQAHGSIDIWSLSPLRHVRRLRLNFSPVGLASIGGDRMLIGSFTTKAAWVLDLRTLKLVRRVEVPAGPVNGLAAGTKHIYLSGLDGITVLDRRTLKTVGPMVEPLLPGNPLGVAVASGDMAYVVDNGAPGGVKPTGTVLGPGSPPFPNGTLQILRGTKTLGSRKLGRDAQEVTLADRGRKLLVTARLDAQLWMLPRP